MEREARCPGKLRFILTEEGLIEMICHSYKCGAESGAVVLHYFDISNGEPTLVKTKKFRDAKILFDRDQQEAQAT